MQKYQVSYYSITTGYGWQDEFDRLADVESIIDEMRRKPSASVDVWDSELQEFIFSKDAFCKPDIDMLRCQFRDMRTKNRKMKLTTAK